MTNRLWTIQATITVRLTYDNGVTYWESMRQVPTFVLDGNVQGIRHIEDAERVARSVVKTADNMGHIVAVSVSAQPLYV